MGREWRHKPNELTQGRLFLCSKSINNGDERELWVEMMLRALGSPRAPVKARGKQALCPPTTPVKFGKTAVLSHLQ